MKHGKAPTRKQKLELKSHGLAPENWLIVKDMNDRLVVVSRQALKKIGNRKIRTRTLMKDRPGS